LRQHFACSLYFHEQQSFDLLRMVLYLQPVAYGGMMARKSARWSPDMIKPPAGTAAAQQPRGSAGPKRPAAAAAAAKPRRGRGKGAGRTVSDVAVDAFVGGRIKLRRSLLGMSQVKLGQAIGLTFQQVQKYERGTNRVGASKLWQLAQVLDVPISFFFDGLAGSAGSEGRGTEHDVAGRRLMQLAADFSLLTEEERSQIAKLVGAIASGRRD
jgi:transcriptional regulator with XRE-family HTH domain